ncbi:hypothetical protein KY289_013465 [Solanum tuberosum]|nr:hypothetical protein KY289_013465 [Solanum tuberosum]
MISEAQDILRQAQRRMKYVDQHYRSQECSVDDQVLLLKLPKRLNIHPTSHVSFLKPYFADEDDPERNRSKRNPPSIPTKYDADIERIFDHRVVGTSKKNSLDEGNELMRWRWFVRTVV